MPSDYTQYLDKTSTKIIKVTSKVGHFYDQQIGPTDTVGQIKRYLSFLSDETHSQDKQVEETITLGVDQGQPVAFYETSVERGRVLKAFGLVPATSPCGKIISNLGQYMRYTLERLDQGYASRRISEKINILIELQKKFFELEQEELNLDPKDRVGQSRLREKIVSVLNKALSDNEKTAIDIFTTKGQLGKILANMVIYARSFDYGLEKIKPHQQLKSQSSKKSSKYVYFIQSHSKKNNFQNFSLLLKHLSSSSDVEIPVPQQVFPGHQTVMDSLRYFKGLVSSRSLDSDDTSSYGQIYNYIPDSIEESFLDFYYNESFNFLKRIYRSTLSFFSGIAHHHKMHWNKFKKHFYNLDTKPVLQNSSSVKLIHKENNRKKKEKSPQKLDHELIVATDIALKTPYKNTFLGKVLGSLSDTVRSVEPSTLNSPVWSTVLLGLTVVTVGATLVPSSTSTLLKGLGFSQKEAQNFIHLYMKAIVDVKLYSPLDRLLMVEQMLSMQKRLLETFEVQDPEYFWLNLQDTMSILFPILANSSLIEPYRNNQVVNQVSTPSMSNIQDSDFLVQQINNDLLEQFNINKESLKNTIQSFIEKAYERKDIEQVSLLQSLINLPFKFIYPVVKIAIVSFPLSWFFMKAPIKSILKECRDALKNTIGGLGGVIYALSQIGGRILELGVTIPWMVVDAAFVAVIRTVGTLSKGMSFLGINSGERLAIFIIDMKYSLQNMLDMYLRLPVIELRKRVGRFLDNKIKGLQKSILGQDKNPKNILHTTYENILNDFHSSVVTVDQYKNYLSGVKHIISRSSHIEISDKKKQDVIEQTTLKKIDELRHNLLQLKKTPLAKDRVFKILMVRLKSPNAAHKKKISKHLERLLELQAKYYTDNRLKKIVTSFIGTPLRIIEPRIDLLTTHRLILAHGLVKISDQSILSGEQNIFSSFLEKISSEKELHEKVKNNLKEANNFDESSDFKKKRRCIFKILTDILEYNQKNPKLQKFTEATHSLLYKITERLITAHVQKDYQITLQLAPKNVARVSSNLENKYRVEKAQQQTVKSSYVQKSKSPKNWRCKENRASMLKLRSLKKNHKKPQTVAKTNKNWRSRPSTDNNSLSRN